MVFKSSLNNGGGGGVNQIIAGTNVTISPSGGTGNVTINSSGGGTPGGTNGQIQYNNSSAFGGDTATTDGSGNWSATSLNLSGLSASELTATDGSKNLQSLTTATYPSLTEISYVKGVTSAIQTQINSKGAGTVTAVSVASANGFAGSSSGGATPALTLSTSITGVLLGNGTAISASNVTNDVQTKAAIVPNTAPSSGQLLVGNAGGTAYAAVSSSGDLTIASTGATTLATVNSNVGAFGNFTVNAKGLITAASTALANGTTGTTQTALDNSTKIATTAYTDAAVTAALNGLDWKPAVGYATTANVVGTNVAGVFTYTSTGVDTIDGHTLALNDVVLFKNQITAADDGVWVVTTAGAIGVAGVLTRRSDYNTAADIHDGDTFFVQKGTVNAATSWVQTNVVTTINTDPLAFSQVAGPGTYAAGTGLTLTGNSFSVNASQTQVTGVGTLTAGATGAGFTVALTTSTMTGTLTYANGGTDQTSYTKGDILYCSDTNTLSKLAIGSTGNVLTVASGLPSWAAGGGGSGTVTSVATDSTLTGGTITTTGTLGINLANANTWTKTQKITATNSSTTALVALGVSSQSATLFDAQITGGTPVWSFDAHGRPIALADGTTTIAAGAGAGTSPSVVTITGNDVAGIIAITTGSSPTASAVIATITFANAYGVAPKAIILQSAAAGSVASRSVTVTSIGTGTWVFSSTTSAISATTAYLWYYIVIG